jgi:putative heme-binding domain-containing protein
MRFEAIGGNGGWRPLRTDHPSGFVDLMTLHPLTEVVAYAWTTIEAGGMSPAVLSCGSDDSIKVWINGRLVLDRFVDRPLVPDEEQVTIRLEEGSNEVLVKCGQNRGGWAFQARIVRVHGRPPDADLGIEARLLTLSGNPERGRQVFFESPAACARCHAVDGRGGRVGPDLSRIGRLRPKSQIVRSILKPSDEIAEGYASVTVVTTEGAVLDGTLLRESPGEIVIATSAGEVLSLARPQTGEVRSSAISSMPEGLEKSLTPAQLLDLVAFLLDRR